MSSRKAKLSEGGARLIANVRRAWRVLARSRRTQRVRSLQLRCESNWAKSVSHDGRQNSHSCRESACAVGGSPLQGATVAALGASVRDRPILQSLRRPARAPPAGYDDDGPLGRTAVLEDMYATK
jgi:hypothetical protein